MKKIFKNIKFYSKFLFAVAFSFFFVIGEDIAEKSAPGSPVLLFKKANDFYKNGQFYDAVLLYKELLKEQPKNPHLCFNYANAALKYYQNENVMEKKEGYLAQAVLYYKRAYRLNPGDQDVRSNLDYVLKLIGYNPESRVNPVMRILFFPYFYYDASFLAAASGVCFFLTGLLVFTAFILKSRASLTIIKIAAFMFVVYGYVLVAGVLKNKDLKDHREAVIMNASCRLKVNPVSDAENVMDRGLHEGTLVEIDKIYKGEFSGAGWYRVVLQNGTGGWVEMSRVRRVWPRKGLD